MNDNQYYSADWAYLELINRVLNDGVQKGDRTGTGTLSVFGHQMRFDLSNMKIPMLTTKKMFVRGIIHEILWYLQGSTNIKYLQDNNVHIWDAWADENGDLGPVYGKQWRNWVHLNLAFMDDEGYYTLNEDDTKQLHGAVVNEREIDQIADVINTLRNNPNDRRIIVNAWNVGEVEDMALPPCHLLFQFWSAPSETGKRKLSCQLYQRSCDVGLGVPFNIVQYSILTHMIAQVTDHEASEFIWTGGDTHIYNNHTSALTEQLSRDPYPSPTLWLNPEVKEIDDFVYDDFKIVGYQSHPTIKMEVSV